MSPKFHEQLVIDLVTEFDNRITRENCTNAEAMIVLGSVVSTIIGSYAKRQHDIVTKYLFIDVSTRLHEAFDNLPEEKDMH